MTDEQRIDELCRLRSDLKSGNHVGSTLRTQQQIDKFIDALNVTIEEITNKPKFKDDILEAYNQISDQEFEHTDNFWIVTPKGKKVVFEKARPKGKWIQTEIIDDDSEYGVNSEASECSNCRYVEGSHYWTSTYYHFCPNCGADMRGKEE